MNERSDLIHSSNGLESYPPFHALNIRVLKLDKSWRRIHILLPLNSQTTNPGGSMFGGAMACLADPIPALACARLFPDYLVWTRKLVIDFRQEGRGDLELRFAMTTAQEQIIREQLGSKGHSTPDFEYGFYNQDGEICAWIKNRVAIRKPADSGDSGGALGKPTADQSVDQIVSKLKASSSPPSSGRSR